MNKTNPSSDSDSDSVIHVLDKDTINKIAAGEVIELPASVVKELVDNSIDAGAKNIYIELKDSGKKMILVRDDGKGMSQKDAVLSYKKHATSKLRNAADLESISTLGFRGEALSSIGAVSKFELITKRKNDAVGTRIYLEEGKKPEVSSIGAPAGTTVCAADLFYNTPARLKYLKSDATELSHVVSIVGDLILANEGISFTLVNNNKTILKSASSDLFNSIVNILGHEVARIMIPLEPASGTPSAASSGILSVTPSSASVSSTASPVVEISGYISKPEYTKSAADNMYFIVNDRPISSKELIKAVRLGYYTKIPNNRYPAVVIRLLVDPKEVDINVHPQKIEVRFQNEKEILKTVLEAVERTLKAFELAPQIKAKDVKKVIEKSFSDYGQKPEISKSKINEKISGRLDEKSIIAKDPSETYVSGPPTGKPYSASAKDMEKPYVAPSKDTEKPYVAPAKDTEKPYVSSAKDTEKPYVSSAKDTEKPYVAPAKDTEKSYVAPAKDTEKPYVASAKDTEKRIKATERLLFAASSKHPDGSKKSKAESSEIDLLENIQIVGQISNLYILAEKDGGLLMIDQHAAHERIFYDLFKSMGSNSVQELISPAVIHLSLKEKILMEEYIPLLEDVGFGISEFGDNSYAISFMPLIFGRMEDVSVVHELISDILSFGKIKDESGTRENIIKRMACRAAIKAGANCTMEQMQSLIQQLKMTENPYSCPHGRPTILIFSKKEIEKMFERT
ncbi:DNA mismatch repair endonuclease MutL [Methanolapillus ohkumae]|uniref:DNA mismatch repair protein MutL n=1 Tax=Methanolapillus ohkumae TaxID=3028298 RepID=A0AA96V5I9_9EURY|nr:DNA mismatch repair protein MutL [Methanosarcinaceae archaeon Am2]